MSFIPTSKDGHRVGTFQARDGTSRVKEECGELGNTKEPIRNGVQAVCKCNEEGEAKEGPRAMIYSSSIRKLFKLKWKWKI